MKPHPFDILQVVHAELRCWSQSLCRQIDYLVEEARYFIVLFETV